MSVGVGLFRDRKMISATAFVLVVAVMMLGSVGGSTIHQDPDDPVVLKFLATVDRVNEYLTANGQSAVKMPSVKKGGWMMNVLLSEGYFGNLSSFVVDDQKILEDQITKGLARARTQGTNYDYNIWLHMHDLVFKYTYDIHILGLHLNHGTLRVTPVQNTFKIFGSVKLADGSSCGASLDDATVIGMDVLRIEFDDETWFHTVFSYSFDIIVNFVYKSLKTPIQDLITNYLHLNVFKEQFSEIICKQFLA